MIAKDKENLYISLKTFKSPTYKIETKNYRIRIDELSDDKYRYASWKIGKKESSKPDIILNNGQLEHSGTGGNHVITFLNNNYVYRIYKNNIREVNSPDIILEVVKGGQPILKEEGTLME